MNEPALDFAALYKNFSMPACEVDCGAYCAPNNPNKTPFCCDPSHALPAAYHQEWLCLQKHSQQWQLYQAKSQAETNRLNAETPEHMVLLQCQGAANCHRPTRAISCRQFPFFPYITTDDRFIGLAYEWGFEDVCWLIRNLDQVTMAYRSAFVQLYDHIFDHWMEDYEAYAIHSEEMRAAFLQKKRRIPILHRNGQNYLLSPGSDRLFKQK